MSTVALIAGLVGTVGQTISGVLAAQAEQKAAESEAASVEAQAASQERKQRRANERILAQQRALSGASGVDPRSGSSLTVLLDSAKEARLEELTIRQRGAQQAENLRAKGRAARATIGGTVVGGVARAGSLLGGFIDRRRSAKIGGR